MKAAKAQTQTPMKFRHELPDTLKRNLERRRNYLEVSL